MFLDNIDLVWTPRGSVFLSTGIDEKTLADGVAVWGKTGLNVRWVRGRKMTTVARLFDEFSAALQFPYYFGENWAAFDECLSEEDWISRKSLVLVVTDADVVLADEESDLSRLVEVFVSAHAAYSQPISVGEWWDRPAIPFHVVLQLSERGSERWVGAVASLVELGTL